jgi:hypothetical protein
MQKMNTYLNQLQKRKKLTKVQRYIAITSILMFFLVTLLVSSYLIKQQQRHIGRAQQTLPKAPAIPMTTPPLPPITFPLTPTHYCLGACPTTTPTLSTVPTPTSAPLASPTIAQPTSIPTPTTKQQAPTPSPKPDKPKNIIELIVLFLKAILEMIQKLFH